MAGGTNVPTANDSAASLGRRCEKQKISDRENKNRATPPPGPRFKTFPCLDNADAFIEAATKAESKTTAKPKAARLKIEAASTKSNGKNEKRWLTASRKAVTLRYVHTLTHVPPVVGRGDKGHSWQVPAEAAPDQNWVMRGPFRTVRADGSRPFRRMARCRHPNRADTSRA